MTSQLSRHTLLLLISNLGGAALSFALAALLGRGLGAAAFGIYAVALAWVYPLSLAVEFGIGTLITRDLAAEGSPQTEAALMRGAAILRLAIGLPAMLLLIAGAPLLSADRLVVAGIQISAPLAIIVPFVSVFSAIFRARGVMWPIPALNIGMLAVQVVLTVAILLAGGGVREALAVNLLTSAGQLAVAWWIYRRRFYRPAPVQKTALHRMLRRAWPFALAGLLAAVQLRLGIILLEQLSTTADAGYFSAGQRFVEAARLLPMAFYGALLPALAALAAQPAELERTFQRALMALAAFGALAAIGFGLLAEPLLILIYGAAFAPGAAALALLGVALAMNVVRGGRTLYWYALGREDYVNRVNAVVCVIQLGISLWLIPLSGAAGAAWAQLVAEVAGLLLLWRVWLGRGAHLRFHQTPVHSGTMSQPWRSMRAAISGPKKKPANSTASSSDSNR
jgi:O-antigen/teichoic acid export membrane protein